MFPSVLRQTPPSQKELFSNVVVQSPQDREIINPASSAAWGINGPAPGV